MKPIDSKKSSSRIAQEVNLNDLRDVFNCVCNHLIESGRDTVTLPHDYYWHIATSDRYDVTKRPEELTLGQLTDNWKELLKTKNGESPAVGYAFVWLAAILESVGEQTIS